MRDAYESQRAQSVAVIVTDNRWAVTSTEAMARAWGAKVYRVGEGFDWERRRFWIKVEPLLRCVMEAEEEWLLYADSADILITKHLDYAPRVVREEYQAEMLFCGTRRNWPAVKDGGAYEFERAGPVRTRIYASAGAILARRGKWQEVLEWICEAFAHVVALDDQQAFREAMRVLTGMAVDVNARVFNRFDDGFWLR